MNWMWLNIPLMAVFFLAIAGIPLWLVVRRPDTGPALATQQVPTPQVAIAARHGAPESPARELVGAWR